ncbi:MAG: putative Voltage-gated potassium channel [Armatimonadetes bacterium]|jgi:hypothetical protein|nr:putative Voltage-gated potassium channel [Armatimonadota bacterium]
MRFQVWVNDEIEGGDEARRTDRPPPPETPDEAAAAEPEADFVPLAGVDGEGEVPALDDIDPFQFDSLQAQQAFDRASTAAVEGNQEHAVQQYIRAAKIAETAHEWYLAAVACRRVGDYLFDPAPPQDLERAFRMYRRAVAAYEQCGHNAEARELDYRLQYFRLRHAGSLGLSTAHRLELFLFWATAGFGLRPLRVLFTAVTLVLAYAAAYHFTGGVVTAEGHRYRDWLHAVYFSGITFSTVGYGDYVPAPHQQFIAMSEGALGIALMGFFVAVLVNRLTKS